MALRTCARAGEIDLDFCVVSPALVEWLLASPLPGRLAALRMGRTAISPELILELVQNCPALRELALPSLMCLGRSFYEVLVRRSASIDFDLSVAATTCRDAIDARRPTFVST